MLAGAQQPQPESKAAEYLDNINTPATGFHYQELANRHEDFIEYLPGASSSPALRSSGGSQRSC